MSRLLLDLRRQKFLTPLLVFAILAMVILPLPPLLLDTLFTFNIVLSMVVILVSLSVRRPLDFSVFPTVILATTLMRLTLNVASTRVVLLNGNEGTQAAGRVIESFGNVVIGGNFVVGLVVFVILMIINFVVVTKGAERISEVSARFTLDALPGKQMAIDADLNAGLINQEAAQARRREVSAEADFYGAMDGASKFVRGDAIAGILILLINLIGGVAIGVTMHGMSAGDAFRQYSLLTIGDGLVAQIPALLLSAAAAIIVTRVSDAGDFEQQVGDQLLASPAVLASVAVLMFVLALIPGMPTAPFLAFAAVMGFVAWRVNGRRTPAAADDAETLEAALSASEPPALTWQQLPFVCPVSVTLGYQIVSLADKREGAPLLQRLHGMRQTLSQTMGFVVPAVRLDTGLGLGPSEYAIDIGGVRVAGATLPHDRLMAIPAPDCYGELDGMPALDPSFGMPVVWIEPEQRSHALGLGYQIVDAAGVIATHVQQAMKAHLAELFTYQDVTSLGERLRELSPSLADALDKALTHQQQLAVIRLLLAEEVSLQDIDVVATALVHAASTTKDPLALCAEVRTALKRRLVHDLIGDESTLHVYQLTTDLENLLLGAFTAAQQAGKTSADAFPLDPQLLEQLQFHMPQARENLKHAGRTPVLLVMPQIRPLLARYARMFASGLHVLSYNEVPQTKEIEVAGTLG
ncbi:FHIPEP family type III secretion protein [Pandoraea nosoerga]|uniref:Flagellar biosynthesis protein FlhA n=1 Tax=Pandoraea nosoerga TaxID=2508296 RepID=A0A5E4WEA0_9BURK|nr:flagellar biosynthesis protein FlhA [Pandoraea nosoerga]MBN4668157.1 FHIPEP family type III secretion protein [Pandoraea nosoerga]MBN4678027.1 FHIPEP family type III secretion protein [Pandoraea nosoerga]MBN4683226.1 FHIPEP family type III secretion protein [Pandoraea nosoerga]MBN4747154.1 FHIPEP family type III secretion protein [Pandoraea nosoerga]VVE22948.1 flagellar biosynthesis protein FlhA [Pandoraea nosoerga]